MYMLNIDLPEHLPLVGSSFSVVSESRNRLGY